eukprot:GFUD01008815.1.p1 GENE.GFUD01008815.1~~GFUD01008815.1.p1  ORF type:complete len:989 (+),score=163.46 GFUD01008815.1:223-3189(+)
MGKEDQENGEVPLKSSVEFSSDTVTVQKLPEMEFAKVQTSPKSGSMINKFEGFFEWLGAATSRRPLPVIVACFIFTSLGCLGLPFLQMENNAIKLWIPQESDFSLNYNWLWAHFPPEFRQHSVIVRGDDVLTPEAIQKMYRIYKDVYTIRTKENRTWQDSCLRIPVVNIDEMIESFTERKKRFADDYDEDMWDMGDLNEEFEEKADYSVGQFYPDPYCDKVSQLTTECFQESLLELWAYKGAFDQTADQTIASLTKEGILNKINGDNYSEFYMVERNFTSMLGGIEHDENGRIVSAKATIMRWMGKMNATRALLEGGKDDAGTGEIVDLGTDEFEKELTKVLLKAEEIEPKYLNVEVNVANSFGDIASGTIWGDVKNLILGFSIVFIYVNIMLGKFNHVEQRGYLSLIGLGSVGMSIGFSYGFCSLIGLKYGPLHNMIPFLLLGIGIDDMFVTMQCFNNLNSEEQKKSRDERFGLTLRRAGAAITVTSLTDFLAFAIGGTTVLPALQSFCIFCAVGLIVVYILQATWFVAWFSIDQRRIEEQRNGSIMCIKHKDFKPNKFSQKNILQTIFKAIANVIVLKPVKALIILFTLVILGFSVWGNILLRQEFNPIWFLPPDSYLAQWHKYNAIHFPSQGEKVTVFMENLDLPNDLAKLDRMHEELAAQDDIIHSLDSWYLDFKKYMNTNFLADNGGLIPEVDIDEDTFRARLTQFLFGSVGSKHRLLLSYDGEITCGEPAPAVNMSMIQFTHRMMSGPKEQIPAMNRVKKILADANFTSRVFPMCIGYASWETDEVISEELYRNICLAILCVFITTWILLFNLGASLQVLGCVVLTLVNVGGFIHFWGLTIDTVSCTNVIISIGLCVDYSAHIAHAFMSTQGTRDERVKAALVDIGPAVFNGGFSTFLAFVLLAGSKSHVFATFFKVFFLVVLFGLYNGLFMLPVALSFIGPKAYRSDGPIKEEIVLEEESEPFKPIIKNGTVEDIEVEPSA